MLLHQLAPRGIDLIAAHLDHGLRLDSTSDAAWTAEFCATRKIPYVTECRNAAATASAQHLTIEEAARRVRYGFLLDVAQRETARWVAVAHTADDQAETVLHNLLRGTGWAGLRGMAEQQLLVSLGNQLAVPGNSNASDQPIHLLRPLLGCRRSVVLAELARTGTIARHDPSNDDPRHTRNRLRRNVLPVLRDVNPQVEEAILRLQQQSAEWYSVIHSQVEAALTLAILEQQPEIVRLQLDRLASLARPMVRECFVALWQRQTWPRKEMNSLHWNALADLCLSTEAATRAHDLPGNLTAERRGGIVIVRSRHP